MISIVYGHPYEKSFNHAILETIIDKIKASGKEYAVMDLYSDHFDPVIRVEDMAMYGKGETNDPIAKMYRDILSRTDRLYFVYPIWWGCEPSIVRGFYDKVLLKGFAWTPASGGGIKPLLKIEKSGIFTTSEGKTADFALYFNNYLPSHILNPVGITNVIWQNLENIHDCGAEARSGYLAAIADRFQTAG